MIFQFKCGVVECNLDNELMKKTHYQKFNDLDCSTPLKKQMAHIGHQKWYILNFLNPNVNDFKKFTKYDSEIL